MLIEVKNINYIYSPNTAFEHYALKDISFNIDKGDFIGIIGHTGSGKSTLIQHLNGLLKVNSGEILYNGKNIYSDKYDFRTLRQKVGLVFQYPEHQLFEVDVLSDVCFGVLNQGIEKSEAIKRAKKALELVGLDESFYDKSPFELSGGQKRRVAIAGVLVMEPELIILDEPTAGLDPLGRKEILDNIKNIQDKENISIILVSHSMEDVANYTKRIIVLDKSQKIMEGSPKEVFQNVEELEQIGLKAPDISYVMKKLKDKGIDIDTDITTITEAKESILKAWRNR